MAAWVDLAALHNPTAGTRPPASWGDGITTDLDFLSGTAGATVLTSNTSASTSYVDLATVGPTVTVDTGANVLVLLRANMANSVVNGYVAMSVAVSGATTLAANDANATFLQDPVATDQFQVGGFTVITGLTPGVNIFTAKYKVAGAGTGTWLNRMIAVIPIR